MRERISATVDFSDAKSCPEARLMRCGCAVRFRAFSTSVSLPFPFQSACTMPCWIAERISVAPVSPGAAVPSCTMGASRAGFGACGQNTMVAASTADVPRRKDALALGMVSLLARRVPASEKRCAAYSLPLRAPHGSLFSAIIHSRTGSPRITCSCKIRSNRAGVTRAYQTPSG